MKKKSIETILNDIINNTKDSDNTITLNELSDFTKNSFNNTGDITGILEIIKCKLNNDKVFIRKKKNSFEILIFIGNRYDIFDIKIKNNDLIVKNVLFEKSIYNNLIQLIGEELIECYNVLFDLKYNIDNYVIREKDFSIIYNYDKVRNNNILKIKFNDIDNTSLEKKLFGEDININSISYSVTKFISENLEMIIDSLRVSKNNCPKGLIDNKVEELKKIR